MPATAPRVALRSIPGLSSGYPTTEYHNELQPMDWRGSGGWPGVVDQLIATTPRIASGLDRMRSAIKAERWKLAHPHELDPDAKPPTPEEERLYDLIRQATRGCTMDATSGSRGRGTWRDVLSLGLYQFSHGFSVFERTWVDDPEALPIDGVTKRLELFFIRPASVQRWVPDREGGELTRISHLEQAVEYGGPVRIPVEDLVHIIWHIEQGPEGGAGAIRSLWFMIEAVYQLWTAEIRRAQLQAGTRIISEGPEADSGGTGAKSNHNRLRGYLTELSAGKREDLMLPAGWTYDTVATTGSASQTVEYMRMLDDAIHFVFDQWLASMGATAGVGTRAVGETLEVRDDAAWVRKLNGLGADISAELHPMLREDFGFGSHVRCPMWIVERDEDPAGVREHIETVGLAITAGIILQGDPAIREIRANVLRRLGYDPDTIGTGDTGILSRLSDTACGCGHAHVVAGDTVTVTGADGRNFEFFRELNEDEVHVCWADNEDARVAHDEWLETEIERAAHRHRMDIYDAAKGGYTQAESDDMLLLARDRYQGILDEYARRLRDDVTEQAQGEAERQAASAPTVDAAPHLDLLDEAVRSQQKATAADVRLTARTIASRVQSEVEQAIIGGVGRKAFATQITSRGLAGEASSIGNQIESTQRLATRSTDEMVPTGARRTVVRDGKACEHCILMDGEFFDFKERDQLEAFVSGSNPAANAPDPLCKGKKKRCRCGFIMRMGRLDTGV